MVAAIHNRSFVLDIQCWYCGTTYSIILNKNDLAEYAATGKNLTEIFYYLNKNERELILSQTCGSCFDSMFPPLDNDE